MVLAGLRRFARLARLLDLVWWTLAVGYVACYVLGRVAQTFLQSRARRRRSVRGRHRRGPASPREVADALVCAAREALTNSMRHADPKSLGVNRRVRVETDRDGLRAVADGGIGFDAGRVAGCHGARAGGAGGRRAARRPYRRAGRGCAYRCSRGPRRSSWRATASGCWWLER